MAELQRIDLLLPKVLLRRLKKEARARHTTFSSLVRESLQRRFPSLPTRAERLDAVRRLGAMSLPIGPWSKMESEIHQGRGA
jgi:hypothetical protein